MWRALLVFTCLVFTACSPDVTSGIGPILGPWCSNLQTQQTTIVGAGESCPPPWVEGVINDCTNIQTGQTELVLMPSIDQCPDGYSGGENIHDACGIVSPTLKQCS